MPSESGKKITKLFLKSIGTPNWQNFLVFALSIRVKCCCTKIWKKILPNHRFKQSDYSSSDEDMCEWEIKLHIYQPFFAPNHVYLY